MEIMRKSLKKMKVFNTGMTIAETVITVAIFMVISMAIWGFGRDIFFFNSDLNSSLSSQFYGRQVLKKMVAEMRSASPSSLGAYPLALVSSSAITFYSNIDDDDYKEQVRYFLQGNTLKKGVTKPSGSPLIYNIANENVSIIAEYVANGGAPIFEYFDRDVNSTSTPLVSPINILAVRLVKITLIMDQDPNRPPAPLTITTQVMLRNLKDNL